MPKSFVDRIIFKSIFRKLGIHGIYAYYKTSQVLRFASSIPLNKIRVKIM